MTTRFEIGHATLGALCGAAIRHFLYDEIRAALAWMKPKPRKVWQPSLPDVPAQPQEKPQMSTLTDLLEQAAQAAITSFLANDSLGQEEKAAIAAIMSAYSAPSITTAFQAAEAVLKVVTDLKAELATTKAALAATAPQTETAQ